MLSLRAAAPFGFLVARPRHTAHIKRVHGVHHTSPLLLVVMLTHVMAASVPGDMYITDSGAEEHVSREIDTFTDLRAGASIPLQTADSTEMKAHVSGTVRTDGVHNAIMYT